ncbi:HV330 protein, partial [Amia calva]|nr:HV330 protein [Amia calva]
VCSLFSFPDASCDVTLTQPASEVKKPGETLRLSCAVSGYSLSDSSYATGWIRQPPGKALEWLGTIYYDSDTYYKQSVQGRITITKSDSSSTVQLQLNSLQPGDTALYYCARETQ